MIILANPNTKEITGYIEIGDRPDSDSDTVVFDWYGQAPEPLQNYQLGTDERSVVAKSQASIDSEANQLLAYQIRVRRDELLRLSDYTQVGDSTQPGTKEQWRTYRTALRGIPQQSGFPNTVSWPTKPE